MFADHKVHFCWIWRIKSLNTIISVCINKMSFVIEQLLNLFFNVFYFIFYFWRHTFVDFLLLVVQSSTKLQPKLIFDLIFFRGWFILEIFSLASFFSFIQLLKYVIVLISFTIYSPTLMIFSSRMWISSVCVWSRVFRQ